MSYQPQIKKLFDSDSTLFKPYPLPDSWLDDWLITSTGEIERLVNSVFVSEFELYQKENDTIHPPTDSPFFEREIKTPQYLKSYPRIAKWPATPNLYPPPDVFGFYLPFHEYPDKFGIYVLEEGLVELTLILYELCQQKCDLKVCYISALYFIYFHEVFHHKVEMLATRWEVINREAAYIGAINTLYYQGQGTDDWPEEMLSNVYSFEKCTNRLKKYTSAKNYKLLKKALYYYIANQPEGYRMAVNFINVAGAPTTGFDDEKHRFWDRVYKLYSPSAKIYEDAWDFGYFDYPLNKVNGKVNFLLPKGSHIGNTLSLNDRFLSTKQFHKKIKDYAKLVKVREGKGIHSIWKGPSGINVSIPSKNSDIKIGTLKSILNGLGINVSVYDFLHS